MSEPLQIAEQVLLAPGCLSDDKLSNVLGSILSHSVDGADLYFQSLRHESWVLEDGIIKEGGFEVDHGVGVRAYSGEQVGFAYSDDILLPALDQAAKAARSIAKVGGQITPVAWSSPPQTRAALYAVENPLAAIEDAEKIALLHQMNQAARAADPRITQVIVTLSGVHEVVLVVDSDGTYQADVRPLVRLGIELIAEEKGRRERASHGGGGRFDYSRFLQGNLAQDYVQEAVRQVGVCLQAAPAPAGIMPVVLGAGWPGVLLHEAIGHGLEGDFNRKGSSAYSGRIGEKVASPLCTVVDDGTLAERRGSLNIDDEGVPTQCTTLIENGVLKGYMQDKFNAKLMGQCSTGNGRRESYAHLPMPRMTNTYMLGGQHTTEDIIASVEKGLYAVNFGGGQVDITSGKFVFNASEAYLIENGKVTQPVIGATLIGDGPHVLTEVSMVGNNLKLDSGVGVCGKDGQSVPVGVGQPTIKVDNMTVGGTEHG